MGDVCTVSVRHPVPVREGPTIGYYQGRTIPEFLDYGKGDRWWFSRIAVMEPDGTVALNQLPDDECLVSPGLVYRRRET